MTLHIPLSGKSETFYATYDKMSLFDRIVTKEHSIKSDRERQKPIRINNAYRPRNNPAYIIESR